MIRTCRLALVLLLVGKGILAVAATAPLTAAVSRADITPPPGVEMWGFSARKSNSIGTIDPLMARVLVLAVGDSRLAIVTLDLGRSFGPESLARLRETARRESKIGLVVCAASHTHSGPVISDHYNNNQPPAWETAALDKIAQAIHEASQHLVEVRIGFGYGMTYIGYNRLQTKLDGRPRFTNDTTRIISSPVDPTVGVIRIDTRDGKPLAILVNYACHPVIFGADNVSFSADFPAAMSHAVEAAFDNKPICFFLQGAPGDIDPYYANTPSQEDPDRWRQWSGEQLGQEAARVAKTITPADEPEASLDYAEDILDFHPRWNVEKFRAIFMAGWGPDKYASYMPALDTDLHLPVATVLINKRIAFAIVPGEPFVELQIDWRNRAPVKDTFFVGYSDGYFGYFPTIPAAARGGYGAAGMMTWVEVGAGERMVNNAVTQTYRMLGKFFDAPQ
jgi:hypothetical protein